MNALKGYRTVILNTLASVIGLLLATDWTAFGFAPAHVGLLVLVLSLANILLRIDTDTAVGKKD